MLKFKDNLNGDKVETYKDGKKVGLIKFINDECWLNGKKIGKKVKGGIKFDEKYIDLIELMVDDLEWWRDFEVGIGDDGILGFLDND